MNPIFSAMLLTLAALLSIVGCDKRQGSYAGYRQSHMQSRYVTAPSLYQPSAYGQNGVSFSGQTTYLGNLSANRFDSDSVSNPYGSYGSRYASNSINNPYGRFGSPYSPSSPRNPYSTSGPSIYGADGTYLGRLSANRYDPDSTSNPYGRYGSQYSPDSVNNPYGRFGNPYSPQSATNPYATNPPRIILTGD